MYNFLQHHHVIWQTNSIFTYLIRFSLFLVENFNIREKNHQSNIFFVLSLDFLMDSIFPDKYPTLP